MISGQSSVITVSPRKSCITKSLSVSTEKMGRLPLGTVSPYVKTSSGGSTDPMKFYCTSYGAAYGQEGFRPRIGFHVGSGYKSNYRPVVQYNPSLDKLDNPAMGKLLQDNYQSTTTKHFQPFQLPDGKYPLPWSVYQPGSGYVREKPLTSPTTKAVKKVHFDTADQGAQAMTGLEPKHTPVLHGSNGKGSVDIENGRHGPHYMSTEYGSKFRFSIPGQPDFLQKNTIGAKEETGFTEGCLANPIVDKQASQESTPGVSVMKTDYLPSSIPHGDEFLPVLSKGSERGTGFSRQKDLRLGASGLPPDAGGSGPLSHSQFQGHMWQPQTQTNLLGRESVGNKEKSGFSLNNLNYVTPAYDPDQPNRFLTSYNSKLPQKKQKIPSPTMPAAVPPVVGSLSAIPEFCLLPAHLSEPLISGQLGVDCSPFVWGLGGNVLGFLSPEKPRFFQVPEKRFYENIPKGLDREGWTRGGIQPQHAGGFATNNHGTGLGTDPNATETLRTVHPHVGRKITTVDPFYRDSPHDHRFVALHQTTVPN